MTPITLTHILTVIVTLYTVESLSDDDIAKMLDERALREQFRDRREYPSNDDIDAFKERIDAIKRRNQDSNELFDTVESDDGAVDENAVHNDINDTDGVSMDTGPHAGGDAFLQRLQVLTDTKVRQEEPHHKQKKTTYEQSYGLYTVEPKTLDGRAGQNMEVLNKYGIRTKEHYLPRDSDIDNSDLETVANEGKWADIFPKSVSKTVLNDVIKECNFGTICPTGPSRKSFNSNTEKRGALKTFKRVFCNYRSGCRSHRVLKRLGMTPESVSHSVSSRLKNKMGIATETTKSLNSNTEKRGGLKTFKRFLCNYRSGCRSHRVLKRLGMTPESVLHSVGSRLKNKMAIDTETTDQESLVITAGTTSRPINARLKKGTQMLGKTCQDESCLKPTTISSQRVKDELRMKDSLSELQKKSNTREMHLIDILGVPDESITNQASIITNNTKQYHLGFTSVKKASNVNLKTATSIYRFLRRHPGKNCGMNYCVNEQK